MKTAVAVLTVRKCRHSIENAVKDRGQLTLDDLDDLDDSRFRQCSARAGLDKPVSVAGRRDDLAPLRQFDDWLTPLCPIGIDNLHGL